MTGHPNDPSYASYSESLSAFAARIKRTPSYITRLKQAGRLVLTDDGSVLVEASLKRIQETADPNRTDVRQRWDKYRAQPPEEGEEGDDEADDASASHNGPTFQAERRRKMRADADLAEMERDRLAGLLVKTAAVRAAGTEAGTVIRAALENLPDQLAPMLAPITDEEKLRAFLADHMESVLAELAQRIDTIAQRVVDAGGEGGAG